MPRLVPFILLFFNFYVHAQTEDALDHAKKYGYNPAFRQNHFDKMIFKINDKNINKIIVEKSNSYKLIYR